MVPATRKRYIIRIALLYVFASFLYLPAFVGKSLRVIITSFVFGYYHLWYLNALCVGLVLLVIVEKLPRQWQLLLVSLLLVGGILLDEYYKIIDFKYLKYLASILSHLGGGRNALFFALPMLFCGEQIGKRAKAQKITGYAAAFFFLLAASLLESVFLKRRLGAHITLDVSVFGWTPSIPLVLIGLNTKSFLSPKASRLLRKIVDAVYILHVWVMYGVEKFSDFKFLPKFVIVCLASFALAAPFVLFVQWVSYQLTAFKEKKTRLS